MFIVAIGCTPLFDCILTHVNGVKMIQHFKTSHRQETKEFQYQVNVTIFSPYLSGSNGFFRQKNINIYNFKRHFYWMSIPFSFQVLYFSAIWNGWSASRTKQQQTLIWNTLFFLTIYLKKIIFTISKKFVC